MSVRRIQERNKRLQDLDPKDKKFVLSRDVTFDEASMLNSTISQ